MTRDSGLGSGKDAHEQARGWIALGRAKEVGESQPNGLQAHLAECAECRDYAEAAERVVSALRSVPLAADSRLVRTTQMRVRARAQQLQQRQQRLIFVAASCALVAVSAALTTPLIWQGFEYLALRTQLPSLVWQVGFVLFWIAPTVAASLLFLGHGTHLSGSSNGSALGE
jgi:predicted anti-sigma-YlaC factor YlaD